MQKCVALVRHGQTEGHIKRIIQGRSDAFVLTPQGRDEMKCAAHFLRTQFADAVVWCSKLKRVRESAEIVSEHGGYLAPRYLDELIQRDWGGVAGGTYTDNPGERIYLGEAGDGLSSDVEPLTWIEERLQRVRVLVEDSEAANHVIVSHNEILNYIEDYWRGTPLQKRTHLPGEVIFIHFNNGVWTLDKKYFPPRLVYIVDGSELANKTEAFCVLRAEGLEPIECLRDDDTGHVVSTIVGSSAFGTDEASSLRRLRTVALLGPDPGSTDVDGLWKKQKVSVTCTGARDPGHGASAEDAPASMRQCLKNLIALTEGRRKEVEQYIVDPSTE